MDPIGTCGCATGVNPDRGGQQRGITAHDALLVEVDVHGSCSSLPWLPRVTGGKKKVVEVGPAHQAFQLIFVIKLG